MTVGSGCQHHNLASNCSSCASGGCGGCGGACGGGYGGMATCGVQGCRGQCGNAGCLAGVRAGLQAGRPSRVGQLPHRYDASDVTPGPLTGTYAYPYYTTLGPRDFLMANPPSIGR